MRDGLEQRLSTAAEELREYELTRQRDTELEQRLEQETDRVAALREEATREAGDVVRLEGLTLTRILASLRGARDDRLARERAEADAARYRLQQAEARLAALRAEHEAVRARLATLSGAPAAYAAVLDEKEQHLRRSGGPTGRRLLELAEEHGRSTGELHELDEARHAADVARTALEVAEDRLSRAAGWSTYDTFFGGGPIGSAVKHSRLDEAADAAAHADRCLAALRTELADIDAAVPTAPRFQVNGLVRFVDIWFDNIVTDLAVQSRITRAREAVAHTIRQVDGVRRALDERAARVRERLTEIAAAREDLLTGPAS